MAELLATSAADWRTLCYCGIQCSGTKLRDDDAAATSWQVVRQTVIGEVRIQIRGIADGHVAACWPTDGLHAGQQLHDNL